MGDAMKYQISIDHAVNLRGGLLLLALLALLGVVLSGCSSAPGYPEPTTEEMIAAQYVDSGPEPEPEVVPPEAGEVPPEQAAGEPEVMEMGEDNMPVAMPGEEPVEQPVEQMQPMGEPAADSPVEKPLLVAVLSNPSEREKGEKAAMIIGTNEREYLERVLRKEVKIAYISTMESHTINLSGIRYRSNHLKSAIEVAAVLPRYQLIEPMEPAELKNEVDLIVYVGKNFK